MQYHLLDQEFVHIFLAHNLQTPNPLRGELLVILLALHLAPDDSALTINTDSQQTINKIDAYTKNNYKKRKKINNHKVTLSIITELIIKKNLNITWQKISLTDNPNNSLNIVDALSKKTIFTPNKVMTINYKAMTTRTFLFEWNNSLIDKSIKVIIKTLHNIMTTNNLFSQYRIASTLNKHMVKSINW